jgi:hypothetical protein
VCLDGIFTSTDDFYLPWEQLESLKVPHSFSSWQWYKILSLASRLTNAVINISEGNHEQSMPTQSTLIHRSLNSLLLQILPQSIRNGGHHTTSLNGGSSELDALITPNLQELGIIGSLSFTSHSPLVYARRLLERSGCTLQYLHLKVPAILADIEEWILFMQAIGGSLNSLWMDLSHTSVDFVHAILDLLGKDRTVEEAVTRPKIVVSLVKPLLPNLTRLRLTCIATSSPSRHVDLKDLDWILTLAERRAFVTKDAQKLLNCAKLKEVLCASSSFKGCIEPEYQERIRQLRAAGVNFHFE